MDFDPFHISSLKSQIATNESTIINLQAEIKQRDEERHRMESQIIKLNEDIVAKDQTIYDLQAKVQRLEQSLRELSAEVQEKREAEGLSNFLKSELLKREQEVALLTRERDMLNWKLINEATTDSDIEIDRKMLLEKNDILTSQNSSLLSELDHLTKKIDLLARRNLTLTSELEKRSKLSDRLKLDFEAAVQSRDDIRAEVDSLKKKLLDVQNSLKSSNNEAPPKRYAYSKPINKTLQTSIFSLNTPPAKRSEINSNKNTNSVVRKVSKLSQRPLRQIEIRPQKDTPTVDDIEKNTVRKLVRNIQSSCIYAPIPAPNAKPYILVQSNHSADDTPRRDISLIETALSRNVVSESIRDILESKLFHTTEEYSSSTNSTEKEVQTKVKNLLSNTHLPSSRDRSSSGL